MTPYKSCASKSKYFPKLTWKIFVANSSSWHTLDHIQCHAGADKKTSSISSYVIHSGVLFALVTKHSQLHQSETGPRNCEVSVNIRSVRLFILFNLVVIHLILAGWDSALDMWAVGILLFWMLTGNTPFQAETFSEILHNVQFERSA